MIVSKTTQKSFYIKTGKGQCGNKYLIMYDELSRYFDMYKLNIHDLVPKIELPYIRLEVPLEWIDGKEHKINKDMIMNVLEDYFNK